MPPRAHYPTPAPTSGRWCGSRVSTLSPWLPQRRYAHVLDAHTDVFLAFFILLCFSFVLCVNQEGGRSKSHRYWPKLGSKHNSATHGKFKVTTKFRTDSGCYATTGLKIKHLLSGQERTVWHLQYTDWPEQGCPEYVQGFLCKTLLHTRASLIHVRSEPMSSFLWSLPPLQRI